MNRPWMNGCNCKKEEKQYQSMNIVHSGLHFWKETKSFILIYINELYGIFKKKYEEIHQRPLCRPFFVEHHSYLL